MTVARGYDDSVTNVTLLRLLLGLGVVLLWRPAAADAPDGTVVAPAPTLPTVQALELPPVDPSRLAEFEANSGPYESALVGTPPRTEP